MFFTVVCQRGGKQAAANRRHHIADRNRAGVAAPGPTSSARSACRNVSCTSSRKRLPAWVRTTALFVRGVNSLAPSIVSRAPIWWLKVGAEIFSRAAARPKCKASATAANIAGGVTPWLIIRWNLIKSDSAANDFWLNAGDFQRWLLAGKPACCGPLPPAGRQRKELKPEHEVKPEHHAEQKDSQSRRQCHSVADHPRRGRPDPAARRRRGGFAQPCSIPMARTIRASSKPCASPKRSWRSRMRPRERR
jgi:hypothetical protein